MESWGMNGERVREREGDNWREIDGGGRKEGDKYTGRE